ncbi:aspartate/glutamate racemase family protein [Zavarzinia compransoris]|uniref:aspartate/glutamate racemase family protein n=1 Tax=Zavarzinia marina TaxID=2911065 RepID=UPI001F20AA3D|nr:aspartate/glutamate racemase family protein [Zavarzinia marina]MCF4164267.1 aspartate/glutamate racemase family protein [Zavarzinia marina]
MRIKIINPNTTRSMTEKMAAAARAVAAPGTEIVAVSPAGGPASIEGHHDEAIATIGLLEEIRAGEREGFDGYVVACFGDPGLLAAREVARGPVVGVAEAAMHVASLVAPGFSVVTTLGRTRGQAAHLAERYGMARFCRRVRAAEIEVLALEDDATGAYARILGECRAALAEDEAGAIVLGCAGMTDLAARLQADLGVPVIDGVTAAVKLVESLVGLGLATSKRGELAPPLPKTYSGPLAHLSPGADIP